ncbi:hypothetical protein J7M23_08640, partial [Candidatus Sumerlaeota bacterium]|nr:hypothetical protein [Candidatus Sumerlaeota bacterium]
MQKYIYIIILLCGWSISGFSSEEYKTDIERVRSALYATLLDDGRTLSRLINQSEHNILWFKDDLLLLKFATTLHLAGEKHLPILALNLLRERPREEVKTLVRYLRSQHDILRLKRLKKEITYQRSASIFNYISSTVSELVNGRTAVLGQVVVDSLYFSFKSRGLTPRMRKLHFLLSRVLQKNWTMSEKEKSSFLKTRDEIAERERKLEITKNLRRVRSYLQQGDFNTAEFYLRQAQKMTPGSEDESIKKWRWRLASAQGNADRTLLADVAVDDPLLLSASSIEKQEISALLSSLLADDRECYSSARLRLKKCFKKEQLATLNFCDSALAFYKNHWQSGTNKLAELIRGFPKTTEANLSRGLLFSEYINPYKHFSERHKQYRKHLWRYILTGERQLDEQTYIATSLAVREARNFASGLGVFLFFDVAIRGVKSLWRTPVD